MTQIHALLYISPSPLNTEEIASTLEVARSNLSTSLKELQGWRIVRLVNVRGDKTDHFSSHRETLGRHYTSQMARRLNRTSSYKSN